MGLFDFVAKQFIDVIHWTEPEDGILAYRFPMQDMEIQNGASLTVRESQLALFVDEGKVADLFQPGRHTLTTQTLPVLTYLKNWDKFFESPFKSDVYFFSTRLQLDRKWGTPNPITIRDKEFGIVRLRAFGIYSYRMTDPKKFYTEVSGTREAYTVDDLDGQLRNTLIGSMTDMFAESGVPFLDMAANQDEFGARLKEKMLPTFERYGLALDNLVVQNVSLPEELQHVLDQRIGMNMVGDLGKYTQYQTANAIPVAAANEGGVAGAGVGLGAGIAMGQAMAGTMAQAATPAAPVAQTPEDIPALLEKLHGLVSKGILSQEEFESKKAELLKKLV
ncbi:MAG: SPFH domain-containing protein [Gammaproteobacteria bacterium]|nr:SPFH domain-containing protein [Gammaproteobacteria bacterium]MBU1732456.1 SPFH domain-containing protein [Gammaproteobacteria bacterium]MBU1894026.1 SPFH domain-containing protein [Gammaproteobacteria bacterium]